ncbi:unnamed protein product [Hydatigera taeniaeformis]|uniref:Nuclear pore complex protein Nup85 n=1 Tax=Hydatigena taeniaeformis TaxID=6205 RepID=A0A0R3X4M3_HYDTA|nr:unnamed protein product [Hydatigera taeniaeformis]
MYSDLESNEERLRDAFEEILQTYLTTALEKFPDNEDLLVCLFFVHVRKCDFSAQQAIARKLHQHNPKDRGFRFWMALSTVLQGEKDAVLAKRMFLPLAERILEKALSEGYFRSHKDLTFYISILKRTGKYSKALDLLADRSFMGSISKWVDLFLLEKINEQDYQHDYSDYLLELNAELGNWSEMLRIATGMLEKDSDNWSAWRTLLLHGFRDEERTNVLLSLIDRFVKQSPNCRGPYLALIDFSANLIKRGIQHPNAEESFCVNLANEYFAKHGRKPIGSLDLSYVLPLLIKSEESRLSVRFLFYRYPSCSFIGSLLEGIRDKYISSPLNDDERVHCEVCAYRLARTNGLPLNLTDLISAYQMHTKKTQTPRRSDSKEIAPADNLLQLAISELLDPVGGPCRCESSLGRLLLAVYWLAEIGLNYSPSNHFMRLQLSSILSPGGGLACTGRQLKELTLLNLKEALNISIGYAAMAPGPILTIFGNQHPSTALPDQLNVNLLKFYQTMVTKIRSIQRETENWLVCAYRRQAFSRIHEYTQFLHKLGHSGSLLLAQTELIYHKVLVTPDSFDDALEQVGNFNSEVASVKEALLNACDNRDFSVVPEFSHRKPDLENRKRSFDHLASAILNLNPDQQLCAWLYLRLGLINLFGVCSKLVMKAVPCIDQIGTGELSEDSRKDLKDLVQMIEDQTNNLMSRMKVMEVVTAFDCTKFEYTNLLLTPEAILISPPPLPKTNMTSFYVHGPFTQTLIAGIDLLKYLTGLLDSTSDEPLDMEKCAFSRRFSEPLLQFIGESSGIPSLPPPPKTDSSLVGLLNPSSVLVGFGVAMETLSIAILFVTAAVALLRPRRSKKNKKKQQLKAGIETVAASPSAIQLDQVAGLIHSVVIPQLRHVANSLQKLAADWATWITNMAPRAFAATATKAAQTVLPKIPEEDKVFDVGTMRLLWSYSYILFSFLQFYPWYPKSEETCPSIYIEMADDLACGFKQLFERCERKVSVLDGALNEVGCFTTTFED